MIKFKDYFLFKEDPDYVEIRTNDLVINTDYDEGEPYGFGFINTDITFMNHKPLEELKDEQGKLIIRQFRTHGQLKRDWMDTVKHGTIKTIDQTLQIKSYDLSDVDQKIQLIQTPFWREINGRIILSPAGRVWKNITNETTGKPVTLISFWHFKDKNKNVQHDPSNFGGFTLTKYNHLEIKPEHVIKILDYLKIPKSNWFDVYVEFMEDEVEGPSHPRITAAEFINSSSIKKPEQSVAPPEELSDEKKERMERVQAKMKRGAHGNLLNPDFGSSLQAKKAKQAGLPSYAEYKAKRNPYGESFDSDKR